MRSYLSIFIFLCLSVSISAQDKLIKRSGEVYEGEVELLAFEGEMPYAILKQGKEKQTINFFDIKSIEKEGLGSIRTMKIGSQFKFVLLIKEGFLSLYRYSSTHRTDDFGLGVIQKFGSESLPVPGFIGFRNQMANYLSECNRLSKRIEAKELKRKDLDYIIEEFNSCVSTQQSDEKAISQPANLSPKKLVSLDQDLSNDFVTLLKYSEKVEDKAAVGDMFKDLIAKLESGEKLPDYLVTALKNAIAKDDKLLEVLNKIIK